MLEALYQLGKLVAEGSELSVDSHKKYKPYVGAKVVFIHLEQKDGQWTHQLEIEDFDPAKAEGKYMFDPGAGKANTPALMPSLSKASSAVKKIIGWLKPPAGFSAQSGEHPSVLNYLQENKERIIADIEAQQQDFPKKQKLLLGLKINGKYAGEVDWLKALTEFRRTAAQRQAANRGTCALCQQSKDNIMETPKEFFKFYTIDKRGYIAGGLSKKHAWRNFPVCTECYEFLRRGREFVEGYLKFKFYGTSYYVIPDVVDGYSEGEQELQEILEVLLNAEQRVRLTHKKGKLLRADEEEILGILGDKHRLVYHLLFLKKEQAAERIMLLIEDVPPSRILELFEAKRKVEELFQWQDRVREYTIGGGMAQFLGSDLSAQKFFFELLDRIFKGRPVNKDVLFNLFMRVIRTAYFHADERERGKWQLLMLQGLMTLFFLSELQLLNLQSPNPTVMVELPEVIRQFLEPYERVLNSPEKQAVFLLGALTEYLMVNQKRNRGNAPFARKLKGFKMGPEDIRNLLPEIANKLRAYQEEGSRFADTLKQAIAQLLLVVPVEDWKLSRDELNFYFVAGMTLYRPLKQFFDSQKQEIVASADQSTMAS